jgi:hypothetical protein
MKAIDFPFNAIDKLTFNPKPQPLPASLRPVYRIALIIFVLKTNCRGNTGSLLKLQFFNWILKSKFMQEFIDDMMTIQRVFTIDLIHLDPMVNLALKYAFAENLISVTDNSKYILTEKGYKFADRILQDEEVVLGEERKLLIRIGQRISEVRLRKELL